QSSQFKGHFPHSDTLRPADTSVDRGLGETTFKNLSEPIGVHALHLGAPSPVSTVDPICRMRIEHQQAAGYLRHHGHEYWFCSLKCAAQFAREAADQP
ncbi:MAG: YHS domain-containing protein, partial [Mycolicibacterium sp.]